MNRSRISHDEAALDSPPSCPHPLFMAPALLVRQRGDLLEDLRGAVWAQQGPPGGRRGWMTGGMVFQGWQLSWSEKRLYEGWRGRLSLRARRLT